MRLASSGEMNPCKQAVYCVPQLRYVYLSEMKIHGIGSMYTSDSLTVNYRQL